MSIRLVITLIIFCLCFTAFVLYNVAKRNLMLRYAFLWILFCVSMIIALLIPDVLKSICDFIGIEVVSNFIFLLGFILLIVIIFTITSILSKQKEKIINLAQEVAILKKEKGE